jgi:hypothetical protein
LSPATRLLTVLQSGYAGVRQAAAKTPVRLALFALLATYAKWEVLGQAGLLTDTLDAQHCSIYEESARIAVTKFHELPIWNPYYCGGLATLGTPSARLVSPTFLLTLVFGTLRAEPLAMTILTVVGLEGAFRYARARGGGVMGAFLAAPIFALCGCFSAWSAAGWTHFYGFELIPWALLGAHMTFRGSRRGVVILAIALAWMIGFGGTYAAPISGLGVAWEGMTFLRKRLGRPDELWRWAAISSVALLFVAAMSLVRLWPIAETLSSSPRILGGTEGTALPSVWSDLFGAPGATLAAVADEWRGKSSDPFHKAYLVGGVTLPFFLLGGLRRRSLPFLVSSLLWLWLALGDTAHPSLFAMLRRVPPFTMLRAPERVLPMFVIGLAVVVSFGIRRLEVLSRLRPAVVLIATLSIAVLGVNTWKLAKTDREVSSARPMVAPPAPAPVNREFHQTRGNRWLGFYYMEMNRGTLTCFDDYNVAESPDLKGDLSSEEYLRAPDAGTVTERAWAPNRIEMEVSLSRPARVYINQNWHPGWHVNQGTLVNDNGLLAVDLPAGPHDVVLHFWPRSAIFGGLTSLMALAVAVYVWAQTRRTDRFGTGRELGRQMLIFASPWCVAALGFAVVREARRSPPPLVTPDGEPIVGAPPADASPVGARWDEEGIVLEDARLLESPGITAKDAYVTVELDWRLLKRPPSGLAISLHVEGIPKVLDFGLDYALLSGALLFDDAPINTTLRDVSQKILVPKWADGKEVRAFVQLHYARRASGPLTDVHGATVADDGRVLVGSTRLQ